MPQYMSSGPRPFSGIETGAIKRTLRRPISLNACNDTSLIRASRLKNRLSDGHVSLLNIPRSAPPSRQKPSSLELAEPGLLLRAIPAFHAMLLFSWPFKLLSWTCNLTGTSRRVCRPWVITCLAVFATFVGVGIGVGWALRTRPLSSDFTIISELSNTGTRTVFLTVDIVSVDPLGRVLTLDWSISDNNCFTNPDNGFSSCPLMNIYFDPNVLAPSQGGGNQPISSAGPPTLPSNTLTTAPIFQYNASASDSVASSAPFFRTQMLMYSQSGGPVALPPTLGASVENYPFDSYLSSMIVFCRQNGTNQYVALSIPVATGVAFGFQVDGTGSGPIPTEEGEFTRFALTIQRAALVKAYVIVVIAAMWMISLVLVAIAIKAVVFGYAMDPAVLTVPAATLFAYTGLRSTLPGAPSGFGAIIDFVGTLPAIAFLLLASMMCLISFLMGDPKQRRQEGV